MLYGLPYGALVWSSGYLLLPIAGLYKPIWEYDVRTLGDDLSAHLAYGVGTSSAFWLRTMSRIVKRGKAVPPCVGEFDGELDRPLPSASATITVTRAGSNARPVPIRKSSR